MLYLQIFWYTNYGREKNLQNQTKIIKLINIIILVILFYLSILIKLRRKKKIYFTYLENKYAPLKEAFNKATDFIKSCLSSDLLEFDIKILSKDIKASVVVPLFNCEKYILRTIKSIQYQIISDIEIILIDDNSKDNTVSLVKKIQNKDKRIKIIRNKKNMGILYSRSIGVLSSKGKFLL